MREIDEMRKGVYRAFVQVIAFQIEREEIPPEELPKWCKAIEIIVEKRRILEYQELGISESTLSLILIRSRSYTG